MSREFLWESACDLAQVQKMAMSIMNMKPVDRVWMLGEVSNKMMVPPTFYDAHPARQRFHDARSKLRQVRKAMLDGESWQSNRSSVDSAIQDLIQAHIAFTEFYFDGRSA